MGRVVVAPIANDHERAPPPLMPLRRRVSIALGLLAQMRRAALVCLDLGIVLAILGFGAMHKALTEHAGGAWVRDANAASVRSRRHRERRQPERRGGGDR